VHPQREAINSALVEGTPYRAVAQRFAASPDAVFRHKRDHIAGLMAKAAAASDVAAVVEGGSLLDQVRALTAEARAVLAQAKASGDGRLALLAIEKATRMLELQAKLVGGLESRPEEAPLVMVFGFDASKFPDAPAIETTALTPVRNGSNGHDGAASPSGANGEPQ